MDASQQDQAPAAAVPPAPVEPINATETPAAPSPEATPAPPAPPAPLVPGEAIPTTMPEQTPAPVVTEEKVLPEDWPCRGFHGAQPWEAVNPPALTHNQRMVTSGTSGPEVVELAALLARLGYATGISEGRNPHAIYDAPMAAVVARFASEYGVKEDPAIVQAMTPDVVGPWLWEALFRAVHKAAAEAQE